MLNHPTFGVHVKVYFEMAFFSIIGYRSLSILTSLPQNQYVISISDLRERVANIMQTRK